MALVTAKWRHLKLNILGFKCSISKFRHFVHSYPTPKIHCKFPTPFEASLQSLGCQIKVLSWVSHVSPLDQSYSSYCTNDGEPRGPHFWQRWHSFPWRWLPILWRWRNTRGRGEWKVGTSRGDCSVGRPAISVLPPNHRMRKAASVAPWSAADGRTLSRQEGPACLEPEKPHQGCWWTDEGLPSWKWCSGGTEKDPGSQKKKHWCAHGQMLPPSGGREQRTLGSVGWSCGKLCWRFCVARE